MTKEKVQNKVDNPMAKEKVQNKGQAIQWPKKKHKIKYRQSNDQKKKYKIKYRQSNGQKKKYTAGF